jgi:hypothetical protein
MFATNNCNHKDLNLFIRKLYKFGKTQYLQPKRQQNLSFCRIYYLFFIGLQIPFEFPQIFLKKDLDLSRKSVQN